MNGRLELALAPDWDTIKATWDPCMEHLGRCGLDPEASYSLCMVTQELLENSVKYGSFGPGRETIHLLVQVGRSSVTIEVRTPLASDADLRRLDEMVQWIRGFQNPFEAYVERLKEVAAQPYVAGESGLGLVRAAYEGQCILDFYIDDDDSLSMSALYHPATLPPPLSHADPRDAHRQDPVH